MNTLGFLRIMGGFVNFARAGSEFTVGVTRA